MQSQVQREWKCPEDNIPTSSAVPMKNGAVVGAQRGLLLLTGAGIFLVFAGWAVIEVQVKLLSDGFLSSLRLDLNYGWKVVPFRNSFVADELVAILGKAQLGGGVAIAECDVDDLLAGSNNFVIIIDEANLDLLVFVNEEFNMRLNFGDEFAAGWAGFASMFVVVFVGGIGEKSQCESEKGRKQFGFHGYEVCSFGVVWQTALRMVPQGGNFLLALSGAQ
jgi:hypothetical protein